ncbi:MAG: hypothetical protein ACRELY_29975 [Polyangiaceae bacterium]
MEDKPGKTSLSGVLGIEVRVRDAISQLVLKGLDDAALEGVQLLLDLRAARAMSPGSPQRAGIVTLLIGFHTRAMLAMVEHDSKALQR